MHEKPDREIGGSPIPLIGQYYPVNNSIRVPPGTLMASLQTLSFYPSLLTDFMADTCTQLLGVTFSPLLCWLAPQFELVQQKLNTFCPNFAIITS